MFKLMLPADVQKQLEESAHNNGRDLSAEITLRLMVSLSQTVPTPTASARDRANALMAEITRLFRLLNEADEAAAKAERAEKARLRRMAARGDPAQASIRPAPG